MSGDAAVRTQPRTLILTAFPAEADAVLARTTLDDEPVVVVAGRRLYLGLFGGANVVVAMTGIGMTNAAATTEAALTGALSATITAVVFTGVAGGFGRTRIGDVAVPRRWMSAGEDSWHDVDLSMLEEARRLDVQLKSTGRFRLIDLRRRPALHVGGDGFSGDHNNGAAFPSIPLGGAVFGPQPLRAPDFSRLSTGNFVRAVGPFLVRGVTGNITGFITAENPEVDAVDQETAAAQRVADAHGIPFLGIRGMSDGPGDPLKLSGFPFTFFVYKRLAADNAAIVTEAFLQNRDGCRG